MKIKQVGTRENQLFGLWNTNGTTKVGLQHWEWTNFEFIIILQYKTFPIYKQ